MESVGFGIFGKEIRKVAYQISLRDNVGNRYCHLTLQQTAISIANRYH
jgi:hypothetical protein